MRTLFHIIYASSALVPLAEAEVLTLLARSRENNARLGVTGMLLHQNGSYFQVLEGAEETLGELFGRIRTDPRHHGVTTIIREPIAHRSFGEWTMGFAELTRADVLGVQGVNDFFGQGSAFRHLDAGRAKKLLASFAQGRWRARPMQAPSLQAAAR